MIKKDTENLYSEEISLISSPEYIDYISLNIRKIKEFRQNFNIPIVGIAGADGKTTTKRMISAILSQNGPILETPLDCDTASAVTSTLLKLNKKHNFALIELGIVNKQQFKMAVEVAQPNVGIVTNIGEAHLASLGDKYIIADAKVELIRNLPPEGFALLNIDDDLVSGMESFSPTARILKFGFNNSAHFSASNLKYLGPEGMEFKVNNYYKFHLPIYSSASVSNAVAAIAAARILNFEFEEIQKGLEENFELLPGRGDLINLNDVFILNHSYNATVNSVSKACESLVQFKKFSKKLILVLGNIEELGDYTRDVHLNLGYYISALPIDMVITVGEDAKLVGEGIRKINHNKKTILHCQETDALPALIYDHISPHTTLLISGGKKLKLNSKLQDLVKHIQK